MVITVPVKPLGTELVVAEYVDGDEVKPTRTNCVDKYVMNAMHKHLAYTFIANRSQRPPDRTSLSPPRPSNRASRNQLWGLKKPLW